MFVTPMSNMSSNNDVVKPCEILGFALSSQDDARTQAGPGFNENQVSAELETNYSSYSNMKLF